MRSIFAIFILFFSDAHCCSLQNSEIVFTFLVNRHGDKTPFKYLLQYSNDLGQLKKLLQPLGFGQLSDTGKDHCYHIGKYIRKRYGKLLSPTFVPDELFVRSIFSPTTITSTLNALAGIYNLDSSQWMKPMSWTPLPYSAVLPKYDYNLAFLNCPAFISKSKELTKMPIPVLQSLDPVFKTLSQVLGFNVTEKLPSIPLLYDFLSSKKCTRLPFFKKLKPILPGIKTAASHCLKSYLGNPSLIGLQSGVLLNEFLRIAGLAIAGSKFPKVYIHSAHDFNVYSFLCATKAKPNPGPPPFGSIYALELRKEIPTGKFFVLPMYVSHPGVPETYLMVDGCGGIFCEFGKFKSLISQYAMDINQWRSKCGWSEDMNVNNCGQD